MSKRDKYGNYIDFSDDSLCDVTTKGLAGHYAETIVQVMAYALHELYGDKLDGLVSAVSTFRTVYVQAYTLSCVIEDICPGLDGMECAINGIFGKDSDEAHIVDGFQRVYETLDSVVSDEGNVDVQKFLGSKSDLALGDRMKALLGLVDGKLGWVERIGIEKSAWVAKAKAE